MALKESTSADDDPAAALFRVTPAPLGQPLSERDVLGRQRARVFFQVQAVWLLVALGLSSGARALGAVSPELYVWGGGGVALIAAVTGVGWALLSTRIASSTLVMGVLLVNVLVGYPMVFLLGGGTQAVVGAVLVGLWMVPIFAGQRFAIPMAAVHQLLFSGLLYGVQTGRFSGVVPDGVELVAWSTPMAIQAWAAFTMAWFGILLLNGHAPVDLLGRHAALASQAHRNTSALERASRRLVIANGDLTELNQELAATISQLGVVNDQRARSNGDLERANADLERAINDLEAANDALHRSNERLDQFNTAVSHDLRAPLQAITARAELAAMASQTDPDRVSRMADQICDSAERMARQLDELHKLSRVEDRLEEVEEVHLGELLGEIVHELDPRIRQHRAHLEVVHPLPNVSGSRALLSELFQNLVDNAIKYGSEGGPRVRVAAAEAPDGWVAASVEDDGPGVPEDQRARVFQLFRRLSRDQQKEGLGAGLAIVRRIADVHGGVITIEEGKYLPGARFVVRLPNTPLD